MGPEASFSSRKKYEENAAFNADAQKHAMSILSVRLCKSIFATILTC